jgi:hypothetical protein
MGILKEYFGYLGIVDLEGSELLGLKNDWFGL